MMALYLDHCYGLLWLLVQGKLCILNRNNARHLLVISRFSDHPLIKVDPPYWAGERFAVKASSLVDITMLEPTIPNLQFWGIMACLEYGRASGARYDKLIVF